MNPDTMMAVVFLAISYIGGVILAGMVLDTSAHRSGPRFAGLDFMLVFAWPVALFMACAVGFLYCVMWLLAYVFCSVWGVDTAADCRDRDSLA